MKLTRATLDGHAGSGVIERPRHPRPEHPLVPGQQSSSTESWLWNHPPVLSAVDVHAQVCQENSQTGGALLEAGPEAHEVETPPWRSSSHGNQGGGTRDDQVQHALSTPSSLVGWTDIDRHSVRQQELDTDQRAAAVMRTLRSTVFLAVRRMVADGRLADHDVPDPPDACLPCSSSEWDCLMFAWRARLLELRGTHPLGEAGGVAWASRISHRSNAVDAIKRSSDYDHIGRLESDDQISATLRPRTPDPLDRTVSKRHWEMSVQDWRARLRRVRDATRDRATRAESVPKQVESVIDVSREDKWRHIVECMVRNMREIEELGPGPPDATGEVMRGRPRSSRTTAHRVGRISCSFSGGRERGAVAEISSS